MDVFVTAATLPILPDFRQVELATASDGAQVDAGTSGKRGDEPGGQNRRVPEGFGARRALRA